MEKDLLDLTVFNPGSMSKTALLAEFTARREMLKEILKVISENRPDEPQQHLLLIGPRGMGKTFTLWAVAYSLQDDPTLNKEWLPVVFSEENYGIGDLADFWLESLRRLQETLGTLECKDRELLEENPPDLAEKAKEAFLNLLTKENKRVILLLDNINEIFDAITNEKELHDLRAFLMEDSRVMVIGSSPTYFSHVQNIELPFYDFFRVFTLERFQKKEMDRALHKIAKTREDKKVLEILEKEPERIHSLRILTGGNPRLIKMVYRLLHEGIGGSVQKDLQRLLDDCTPYFKHRIESLKTQPRRVFDAIARQWDPVTVGNLSTSLRKPSNHISSQVKRLVEEGFIEEAGGTEKKKAYQVAERFYNIFYLMRYSRTGRQRLNWLVGFMKVFYKLDDYRKWSKKIAEEIPGIKSPAQKEERLAFLSSMASAVDDSGLRKELLQQTIRSTIDASGLKALSGIIDSQLAKKELGVDFSILDFINSLDKEQQKAIGYKPESSRWWTYIAVTLYKKQIYELSEQACRKSIELDPEYAYPWNGLGVLLGEQLQQYEEAEEAYRKSIELDPELAYPWYNLGALLQIYLQRYKEAEAAYRKAIELDSEYAHPYCGLADLFWKTEKRKEESIELSIKGICFNPDNNFTRHIFLQVCPDVPEPWLKTLPEILSYLKKNPEKEKVSQFVLDGLIRLVRYEKEKEAREMIKAAKAEDQFGPFLIALDAKQDRKVLQTLAPERRALIVEVMEKIENIS